VAVGSLTVASGTWANQRLTRGMFWLVVKVPRGPVKGCHVAPRDWLLVLCKILLWLARESNRRPPGTGQGLAGLG
jgi:hypothetical protein